MENEKSAAGGLPMRIPEGRKSSSMASSSSGLPLEISDMIESNAKDCGKAFAMGFMPLATGRAFGKMAEGEEPSALESGILGALDVAIPGVPYLGGISRVYQLGKIKELQDKGIYVFPEENGKEPNLEAISACHALGYFARNRKRFKDIEALP